MSVRRAALTVWILFQLAVIGVYFEIRGVELKYQLARRGRELQSASLEQRTMRARLETARRPEALMRRSLAAEGRPALLRPRRSTH